MSNSILSELKINTKPVKEIQLEISNKNIESLVELAKRLALGKGGVKKNVEQAKALLEQALEENNGEAGYILGRLYLENILISDNNKVGIEKIEQGSLYKYEPATLFLGYSALNGLNGIPKDLNIADKNLRRLAMSGNIEAQYQLGKIYEFGIVDKIKPDLVEAIRWYEKAESGGVVDAMNRLGYIYFYGSEQVKLNYDKSITYWTKELEKRHSDETLSFLSKALIFSGESHLQEVKNKTQKDMHLLETIKRVK